MSRTRASQNQIAGKQIKDRQAGNTLSTANSKKQKTSKKSYKG